MEYGLIFFLQVLGVSLHIVQKITELGKLYPELKPNQIVNTFWNSDWDTLLGSGVVLLLNLTVQFIIENYATKIYNMEYFHLISFGIALILGYAGQRLIYKWLGTAADSLDKKVTDNLNK
jgi:hypothetical protein